MKFCIQSARTVLTQRRLHVGAVVVAVFLAAAVLIPANAAVPQLIVVLVVDQFRADYVEKFKHQWTSGLRHLLTDGAWFRQTAYPYFNTLTCPGHATVSTGTYPASHGMILNSWWDRTSGKRVACADDPDATIVSYGKRASGIGESAVRLRMPTLADELRTQLDPHARAASFSLKARAAVTLAGHNADAIAWFADSGVFISSSRYDTASVPAVADFVKRHPIEERLGAVWDLTLPRQSYLADHSTRGVTTKTFQPGFPHALKGQGDKPDRLFYDRWQTSPFSDEYLAQMALDVSDRLRLGRRGTTDFLAIGFSALDKVGHDFGPTSEEVQDVLVRLDRTLGVLFSGLDRSVGSANYTVALTSDHGVAPIPERAASAGLDAGRTTTALITQTIERVLDELGPGKHVAALAHFDVYLESGVMERLRTRPTVVAALREALRALPGVLTLYTRDEIENAGGSGDALLRRLAHGHDPDRSGDIVVVPKPYWLIGESTGASHGTGYDYDARVPLFLLGKGIARGEYATEASPADVAPTLAYLAGVALPRVDGRVLHEALAK
jgi:predicted AlkP superfamily pyrophosphatase or phosphodiesterase